MCGINFLTIFTCLFSNSFSPKCCNICHMPIKNIFHLLNTSVPFFFSETFPSLLLSYSDIDWFSLGLLYTCLPGISLGSHLGSHITALLCWSPYIIPMFLSVLLYSIVLLEHISLGKGKWAEVFRDLAPLKCLLFDKV